MTWTAPPRGSLFIWYQGETPAAVQDGRFYGENQTVEPISARLYRFLLRLGERTYWLLIHTGHVANAILQIAELAGVVYVVVERQDVLPVLERIGAAALSGNPTAIAAAAMFLVLGRPPTRPPSPSAPSGEARTPEAD